MTDTLLTQLTDEELLRYVNRANAETRELAERLEEALSYIATLDPQENQK